ncbi:hypothetical protein AAKU55_004916 [Oxalobacteraceae bacterium GrIS 1.11]
MSNPSICHLAISRMVAALSNATGALDRVFDSREAAYSRDEMPCIAITAPDSEESKAFGDGVDEHSALVTVDVLVRGDPWRAVADPIAVDVHRILMRDAQLLAMLVDMRKQGRKWEGQEADQTAGCDSITYRLVYLSRSNDMSASI